MCWFESSSGHKDPAIYCGAFFIRLRCELVRISSLMKKPSRDSGVGLWVRPSQKYLDHPPQAGNPVLGTRPSPRSGGGFFVPERASLLAKAEK